jgi:two-component system nitrogen regulation sensor histidine kinase NtrY
MLSRLGFRARLFLILLLFALIPSLLLSFSLAATSWWALPLVGTSTAWDSTAATGSRALDVARARRLSSGDSLTLREHEQNLNVNLMRSKQASFIFQRGAAVIGVLSLLSFGVLLLVSSRVAGHLSRSLSRPLRELVEWTGHIARGHPLPDTEARRGAPEFEVLRGRMRDLAAELEQGRRAALEAERVAAMRETARQVAHELKNPLTPIRFAVDRLRKDAPPALQESVEVLAVESARLEALARSFAQFGRLPEGPRAPVDVGELARYTARATAPPEMTVDVRVAPDVPLIQAHHEPLSRALSNVVLNAVEACGGSGTVTVTVDRAELAGAAAVALAVHDTGPGIPRDKISRIWDPYVTFKSGGTGLGLAIARQTVEAHGGRVSAASEPGRGTTIEFLLPVS